MGMSKENKQRVLDELKATHVERASWNGKRDVKSLAEKRGIDLTDYEIKRTYGKKLRELRRKKRYTLKEIARLLHMSPQAVQKIEKPQKAKTDTPIDLLELEMFALIYDVEPIELISDVIVPLDPIVRPVEEAADAIMYFLYYRLECTDTDFCLFKIILQICALRKTKTKEFREICNCLNCAPNLREIKRIKWRAVKQGVFKKRLEKDKALMGIENKVEKIILRFQVHLVGKESAEIRFRQQWLKNAWEEAGLIAGDTEDQMTNADTNGVELERVTAEEIKKFGKLERETLHILACAAVTDQTNKSKLCEYLQGKIDLILSLPET